MDLKELDKFFKLCRKQGINEINYNNVSVKFGDLPIRKDQIEEQTEEIPTDGLTDDELMFYHLQGGKT